MNRLEDNNGINIKKTVIDVVKEYNKTSAFTDRKIVDTPTDDLQVVNRKFVTNNGSTLPVSPVTGQMFFSSVLSKPVWYNSTNWVDSTASIIA